MLMLGSGSFSGKTGWIVAAGELELWDSQLNRLAMGGELKVEDSSIKHLMFGGQANLTNCEIKDAHVGGELTVSNCKIVRLKINGVLNADNLRAGLILDTSKNSGPPLSTTIKGSFSADALRVHKIMILEATGLIKNLLISGKLTSPNEIQCQQMFCFGEVHADCVSADYLYVFPNSANKVASLTGTDIIISERWEQYALAKAFNNYYPKSLYPSLMSVDSVEGDNISADNLKARYVAGKKIILGNCEIERVEYSEELQASPQAKIKEAVKI